MSDTITYRVISDRINNAARELTPNLPTENTEEAWSNFLIELEDLDVWDLSYVEIDSWDWTVYTHNGFKILEALPSDQVHAAEAAWHDMDGPACITEADGPYEIASQVAYHALTSMLGDALVALRQELTELAECQLEALEGTPTVTGAGA